MAINARPHASLVECAVFRPPPGMESWRFYRIEYGDGKPEGAIWLPPDVDRRDIEAVINGED